jgi:hypothetical protein
MDVIEALRQAPSNSERDALRKGHPVDLATVQPREGLLSNPR